MFPPSPPSPTSRTLLRALFVLSLAAAAACGVPSPPGQRATSSQPILPAVVVGAVLPGPLNEPALAEAIYAGGVAGGAARWRPTRLWQVGGPTFDASPPFTCINVNVLPFEEGGKVRAYVVGAIRPPDHSCPRCAPIVGAMALTEVAGGWRVDAVDPELAVLGGGEAVPGSANSHRIAPSPHALFLETDVAADGRRETSFAFFAGEAGRLIEVLKVEEAGATSERSCGEGKAPRWGSKTSWDPVRVRRKDLYDLVFDTSGTRLDGAASAPVEVDVTHRDTFQGSRYELVQGGTDAVQP